MSRPKADRSAKAREVAEAIVALEGGRSVIEGYDLGPVTRAEVAAHLGWDERTVRRYWPEGPVVLGDGSLYAPGLVEAALRDMVAEHGVTAVLRGAEADVAGPDGETSAPMFTPPTTTPGLEPMRDAAYERDRKRLRRLR